MCHYFVSLSICSVGLGSKEVKRHWTCNTHTINGACYSQDGMTLMRAYLSFALIDWHVLDWSMSHPSMCMCVWHVWCICLTFIMFLATIEYFVVLFWWDDLAWQCVLNDVLRCYCYDCSIYYFDYSSNRRGSVLNDCKGLLIDWYNNVIKLRNRHLTLQCAHLYLFACLYY